MLSPYNFGGPLPAGTVTIAEHAQGTNASSGVRYFVVVDKDGTVRVSIPGNPDCLALYPGDQLIVDSGPYLPTTKDMPFVVRAFAVRGDKS